MANITQQPLLSPLPNPEPPSFPILRDILSRKFISQEASPYGFSGSPQQAQSLYTGGGRGMFDPYSGGYGGGGMQSGGMQGGGGGGYGFQPPQQGGGDGDFMRIIMQLLGSQQRGMGQGPQQPQPRVTQRPMMGGDGMQPQYDGYTLNNQISHEGDFDGCAMGNDARGQSAMPPPQPGGMARPPMDPRKAAAMRAIMAAIMAKRRGQARPQQQAQRPIGMDSPYHDQRGPMAPLGMDGWQGNTYDSSAAATQANRPYLDIESRGIPWMQQHYGGPQSGSGQQFQTGQWGLPTFNGFQYTGAQHEIGGNDALAQLFRQGGQSPGDFARFLMQGNAAQRSYGMDPASISRNQAAGTDRWGNDISQMGSNAPGAGNFMASHHSANYGNPAVTQAGHFGAPAGGMGGTQPIDNGGNLPRNVNRGGNMNAFDNKPQTLRGPQMT